MRLPFALTVLLLATEVCWGFDPNGPSHDGTRSVVDIPATRHIRNVGGSDGSGLCVFTSTQLGADWQNVRELEGFRSWMERRPGGGWPEKLDDCIATFCREKGRTPPRYVQHTGGDEEFLDRAIATRRAVGVTYAGVDDFYARPIAHMVTLAHLDNEYAAIIDNNRPGVWVWMTRKQFLDRWRGLDDNGNKLTIRQGRQLFEVGGGWGVVLLGPPPPATPKIPSVQFGQCGPLGCIRSAPVSAPVGCELVYLNGVGWVWAKKSEPTPSSVVQPRAVAKSDECPCGSVGCKCKSGGNCNCGDKCLCENCPKKSIELAPKPSEVVPNGADNFGVDLSKCPGTGRRYMLNGRDVPRATALGIFESDLPNDGDHLSLTAVGSAEFLAKFATAVSRLPAKDRDRLHVQSYSPESWAVPHFGLPSGVSVRRPGGETVGTLSVSDLADDTLAALIDLILHPKPPEPKPEPKPDPKPDQTPNPVKPDPNTDEKIPPVAIFLGLLILLLILKR